MAVYEQGDVEREKGNVAGVNVASIERTWEALGGSFLVALLITWSSAVIEVCVRSHHLPLLREESLLYLWGPAQFSTIPGLVYLIIDYTRIGSNKGKTPEHNQAKQVYLKYEKLSLQIWNAHT